MSAAHIKGLRTFYTITASQTFSILGSRMTGFAISLWLAARTGTATPVALVSLFSVLPYIVFSNVAGMVADRWDRRHVMVIADFGQALCTVALMILFINQTLEPIHLYLLSFVENFFGTFQGPASEAVTAMLVPDEHRTRANAVRQMTGPLAGVFAPALAAALMSVVDVSGVMIFDLFTFAVAMFVVFLSHIPRPPRSAESHHYGGSFLHELTSGVRFLWDRRPLMMLVGVAAPVNLLLNTAMVLFVPYVLARTRDQNMVGLLSSLNSAGVIVGGLLIGIWGTNKHRVNIILLGVILMSVMVTLFGLSFSPLALGITIFLALVPNPIVNVSFMSILQAKVPPDMQGRVMAVVMQISMLLTPLGYLVIGPFVDKVVEPAVGKPGWENVAFLVGNEKGAGMGLIFLVSGLLTAALMVVSYFVPSFRDLETTLPDYSIEPVEVQEVIPVDSLEASPVAASR